MSGGELGKILRMRMRRMRMMMIMKTMLLGFSK